MTKDELKAKVCQAIDEAYALGYSEGSKVNQTTTSTVTVKTYNLTNDAVAKFMADKTYNATGFAVGKGKSVVTKYCESLLKDEYGPNTIEKPKCVTTEKGTYWNLIPNKEYTLDGIKFKTTGTVRQIYFPDSKSYVSNCRDLGGYACTGGKVKYGKLIRSAYLPEGLTKTSSVAKVLRDDCGVTCEIDLRGKSAYTTLGWSGVKYNIYGYATVLTNTKDIKNVFVKIISELQKGGCVLYHCHAGADRTGTISALILGVLGVSEADIIKDWELTSFCHWENFKIISQWAERIVDPKYKEDALKEFPKGELREFFVAMKNTYGTKGESFQQQCYAYLTKKIGLTDAQITNLKKALVE